jgi:hypothetical protein
MNKKWNFDSVDASLGGPSAVSAVAAAAGATAATSSAAATISAVGAAVLGTAGGMVGSGIGIATGGVGVPATIPMAVAGAAIGSWAGPALALVGIGTAPAWWLPVAIGGALAAATAVGALIGRRFLTSEHRTEEGQ